MKLCQIIAVESKVKAKAHDEVTKLHHKVQKADLVTGFTRTYQPKEDGPEAETFPKETKKIQVNAEDSLKELAAAWTDLFDTTATKDAANAEAKADVVIGENVLLRNVPVTYLLFLEKKLTDLHTFVAKLPVLDPAETWKADPNQGCYVAEPKTTHKTKKISKAMVLAPATDKHPAQVKEITEDVVQGYWTALNYSSALPADRVKQLLGRVESLQKAVKFAREEANSIEITNQVKVADKIFSFVLGER